MSSFSSYPHPQLHPGGLMPRTGHAPGEVLWGAPPRRQPIVPLIALALLTLLIAAPAAFSGNGQSSNPITLMYGIAEHSYEISGLMGESNEHLGKITQNVQPLNDLQVSMAGIATATGGMREKTEQLNEELGSVGTAVGASKTKLVAVDGRLTSLSRSMGGLTGTVNGSLRATRSIVGQFDTIDTSIGAMDSNLKRVIGLMAVSAPATKAFAANRTRMSIAGGDGHKFGVPNVSAGNRVMSVVLPMIKTMQDGGPLPARKDSAAPSNFLIGTLLKRQVPDGTNVVALIRPYDGIYGLPNAQFFVENQVNGF